MRNLILCLLLVLGLSACSNVTKESLGLNKKAPNEKLVTVRAPLSLPPEYDVRPTAEPAVEVEDVEEEGFLDKLNKA